jgi:regulator of replication initiation timing
MSLLETRLKEVVSKPHTQWEDSTNSTNLNLIQENIELKRENHHMKLRLTELERQPDSMTIKLPGQTHSFI